MPYVNHSACSTALKMCVELSMWIMYSEENTPIVTVHAP